MTIELIVGIIFLVLGIGVSCVFQNKDTNKENMQMHRGIKQLFQNTFGSVFIIIGLISLSQYLLSIRSNEINWKSGLYIFISVCAIDYCITSIIAFAKRHFKTGKKKT